MSACFNENGRVSKNVGTPDVEIRVTNGPKNPSSDSSQVVISIIVAQSQSINMEQQTNVPNPLWMPLFKKKEEIPRANEQVQLQE